MNGGLYARAASSTLPALSLAVLLMCVCVCVTKFSRSLSHLTVECSGTHTGRARAAAASRCELNVGVMIFRDSEEGGPREFTRIDLPAPQPEINLRGEMAEEVLNDFYPDLNELESKVGRKTPESLLAWMKDAADREGWTADPSGPSDHTSDGLSDKINTLKQEMRWLRCADVRILRQLVAVHEGIEAMRWLMEERGLQTSRCSSLSGSLSSLVTIEEHVPSTSPCREDPTPAFPQSIRLAANTKPADQNPSETSEPQSPSKSILVESHTQAPLSAANSLLSADAPKSEAPESGSARFHIRNGAETIKRALLRSSRRKQLKAAGQDAGEKNSERPTQQSLSVFKRQEVKKDEDEEESSAGGEKDLLGYDAQWSWVESKDDVTFL